MSKTRLPPGAKTNKRAPKTHYDWNALMAKVIARAERRTDPRLAGLRAAHAAGKAESLLRKYGIICDADIDREFPSPET